MSTKENLCHLGNDYKVIIGTYLHSQFGIHHSVHNFVAILQLINIADRGHLILIYTDEIIDGRTFNSCRDINHSYFCTVSN